MFKNTNNHYLLRALFLEESYTDTSRVLYTLTNKDHERGYKSLYRLYMELKDPYEYDFANKYFDGWDHWEALCNTAWFKPHIKKWRRQLEIRLRSEALSRIFEEALSDSKNSYNANKFLVEKGWVDRAEGKRGRPTKEEIKNELTVKEQQEDYDRIIGLAN